LNNDELASISLKHLASAYYQLLRFSDAIEHFNQSLSIKNQLYKGKSHRTIATVINNLAFTLKDEALECKDEGAKKRKLEISKEKVYTSLAMRRQLFGEIHRSVATSYINASNVLMSIEGGHQEAHEHAHKAFTIFATLLGEVHPNVGYALNHLGYICNERKNYEESIKYNKRALNIYHKLYGADNTMFVTATTLNNMGFSYEKKGEKEAAREYYQKALEIYMKAFGEKHPRTKETKESLGRVLVLSFFLHLFLSLLPHIKIIITGEVRETLRS
jgi:tetratricopeptide (TPR) repeat protein